MVEREQVEVVETNNVKVLIKKCKKGKHVFQQDSRSLSVVETTYHLSNVMSPYLTSRTPFAN